MLSLSHISIRAIEPLDQRARWKLLRNSIHIPDMGMIQTLQRTKRSKTKNTSCCRPSFGLDQCIRGLIYSVRRYFCCWNCHIPFLLEFRSFLLLFFPLYHRLSTKTCVQSVNAECDTITLRNKKTAHYLLAAF